MRAVFERDFLSQMVRRRSFLLRALVASLVAIVLFLVLAENSRGLGSRPDQVARWLFAGGGVTVLSLLALLAPPAVVGAVLEERQRETLPLVLATPVGPTAFAAAKLLSRSMASLAWALAAFFPLASVLLLGGVAASQVADLGLLSVGVVLEIAGWGVLLSSLTRRLATGVFLAYLIPLGRWAAFMLVGALLLWNPSGPRAGPLRAAAGDALMHSTPLPGAVRMVDPGEYDRAYGASRMPSLSFLACAALLAGASVLAAGRRLAREGEPRGGAPAWFRRRTARPPPDRGNPVLWKESRLLNTSASRPMFYAAHGLMAAAEAVYVVSCCTEVSSSGEVRELGMAFATGYASFLGVAAAVVASTALVHERATGTLDLLRTTLLRPEEILRGKLFGSLRGSAFLMAIPLLHLAMMACQEALAPVTLAAALLYSALCVLFWTCCGAACGISATRAAAAVGRAAAALAAVFVGLPLAAIACAIAMRGEDFGEFLIMGWPPVTAWVGMEALEILFDPAYLVDHPYRITLKEPHAGALAWTAATAVAAAFLWVRGPALLAGRLEAERSA